MLAKTNSSSSTISTGHRVPTSNFTDMDVSSISAVASAGPGMRSSAGMVSLQHCARSAQVGGGALSPVSLQHCPCLRRGCWPRGQIPLHLLAAQIAEHLELRFGLDAFGQYRETQLTT